MTERELIQEHLKECARRIENIEAFMLQKPDANKKCIKNIKVLTAVVKALEEIHKYRELGTAEELREAMEKQLPKKMKDRCPDCGTSIKRCYFNCPDCGQAIDFSGVEDEI